MKNNTRDRLQIDAERSAFINTKSSYKLGIIGEIQDKINEIINSDNIAIHSYDKAKKELDSLESKDECLNLITKSLLNRYECSQDRTNDIRIDILNKLEEFFLEEDARRIYSAMLLISIFISSNIDEKKKNDILNKMLLKDLSKKTTNLEEIKDIIPQNKKIFNLTTDLYQILFKEEKFKKEESLNNNLLQSFFLDNYLNVVTLAKERNSGDRYKGRIVAAMEKSSKILDQNIKINNKIDQETKNAYIKKILETLDEEYPYMFSFFVGNKISMADSTRENLRSFLKQISVRELPEDQELTKRLEKQSVLGFLSAVIFEQLLRNLDIDRRSPEDLMDFLKTTKIENILKEPKQGIKELQNFYNIYGKSEHDYIETSEKSIHDFILELQQNIVKIYIKNVIKYSKPDVAKEVVYTIKNGISDKEKQTKIDLKALFQEEVDVLEKIESYLENELPQQHMNITTTSSLLLNNQVVGQSKKLEENNPTNSRSWKGSIRQRTVKNDEEEKEEKEEKEENINNMKNKKGSIIGIRRNLEKNEENKSENLDIKTKEPTQTNLSLSQNSKTKKLVGFWENRINAESLEESKQDSLKK